MLPLPSLITLSPLLAPLSIPLIEHLFAEYQERHHCDANNTCIAGFVKNIQIARNTVFWYMHPFVVGGKLIDSEYSTKWLGEFFAMQAREATATKRKSETPLRPISHVTLSTYKKGNILRYTEYNTPEFDAAAATAIAFTVYQKGRARVPTFIDPNEPYYWVWLRRHPQSSWERCSFPLSPEFLRGLPRTAVLVTPWPGAAWKSPWLLIGRDMGSARFAGAGPRGWRLNMEDLAIWDPQLVAGIKKRYVSVDNPAVLESTANLALISLAEAFLLPGITWPPSEIVTHYAKFSQQKGDGYDNAK